MRKFLILITKNQAVLFEDCRARQEETETPAATSIIMAERKATG
jgi:hypothetical protein